MNELIQRILDELPGMEYKQPAKRCKTAEHIFIDTIKNVVYTTHTTGYIRRTTFGTVSFPGGAVVNNNLVTKNYQVNRVITVPVTLPYKDHTGKSVVVDRYERVLLKTEKERLHRVLEAAKSFRKK